MAKRTKNEGVSSFELFWEAWPNKAGRLYAAECWERKVNQQKINIARDLVPILRWIDAAETSDQWSNPKYIPRASTAINRLEFLSDPPPPAEVRRDAHANGEPRAEHGPLAPEAEAAIQAYQDKEKEKYELQRRVIGKG
jgi:hypothetical protein